MEGISCIKCGEENLVYLDLQTCETLFCRECEGDYTIEDLEAHINQQKRLVMICKAARNEAERQVKAHA